MMALDWKKLISIEVLIFALSSLGVGAVAWADVKTDIAVVQEKQESQDKINEKIDKKLDKIIDYLLEKKDGDNG